MTGVSFLTPSLEQKRIELVRELVPNAVLIAVLVNPSFSAADVRITGARAAASALGVQLSIINAGNEREIDTAFATSVERRADALLVASDPFFFGRREQLGYAGSTSCIARRLLFARVCHRWRADELWSQHLGCISSDRHLYKLREDKVTLVVDAVTGVGAWPTATTPWT